jgi:hypothetical protein
MSPKMPPTSTPDASAPPPPAIAVGNQAGSSEDESKADPMSRTERSVTTSFRGSTQPPRYVQRNLPDHQSRNMVGVTHNQGWRIGKLVRHDLFHFLLRLKLFETLPLLLLIWSLAILIFAGLYFAADRAVAGNNVCSLFGAAGPITYQGAFAFSLQTCTTVGYTLPAGSNAFFENCPTLQTLIFLQSCFSLLANSWLLAFVYSRVGRAESRSVQLSFSNKAVVSRTPSGQLRFQVRS